MSYGFSNKQSLNNKIRQIIERYRYNLLAKAGILAKVSQSVERVAN